MNHLIAPSLLSADFSNLSKDVAMLNQSLADWLHIDVMDGVFVPNISIGFPVIRSIKKISTKPLDVHLMIIEPERYLQQFRDAGADIITIHYEASIHLHRSIYKIKEAGAKAGVVLNPHTKVELIEDIINDVDLVLLMSVNPGFGGQKFIENAFNKIKTLKTMIISKNSAALIQVDGGVDLTNAKKLLNAGVDILVAGNAIFCSSNPSQTISDLKML
ncbi:MAG: ribulose-phosphate 3-epimerase [Bacteroidales bacterium]|nr:ribulose-phosphate 3-epimerase [Bacteroidales bacterium]